MRPYIGILIDSFWEAVNNKVLWALLIGWSILLACLAPFGYVSERSFQFSSGDIDQRSQLIKKLARGSKGQGSDSAQAIAKTLPEEFQEKLQESSKENGPFIRTSEIAEEMNKVLENTALYTEDAFPTAKKRKRLEPLIELANSSSLQPEDTEELNRELVQLAFPLELASPQGSKLWIGYAGFKIGEALPINRRQMREFFEPVVLQAIIKLGLAVLAVFIAIIVTSPIIPDTFRSGSLHLLLSKPISRVWLYLSKFFGGTIFVFVNIAFVLIGLYFIAGLRFEIWNNGLLLCVPILMIVFIIFYAISGLAGLLWGNAIVCVVSCMLFWFACFCLTTAKQTMQPIAEIYPNITRISQIDDNITMVNEMGEFGVWNDKFDVWQPAVDGLGRGGPRRTFGPIYDSEGDRVLIKSFGRNPFGATFSRSRKLAVVSLGKAPESEEASPKSAESEEEITSEAPVEETVAQAAKSVQEAREKPLWMSDPGPEIPAQLFDIVRLGPDVVAVCRGGLYKLDLEQLNMFESKGNALFGLLNVASWASKSAFQNIAPTGYILSENSNAAATPEGDGVVIFSSGQIDFLQMEDDKFVVMETTKLEGDADNTEAALIEMNARYCVLVRDGLPIEILDAKLQPLHTVELDEKQKVKQIDWAPGSDSLSIVTHTGKLLKLDCEQAELSNWEVPYQGYISSASWTKEGDIWLGVQPNIAAKVDAESGKVIEKLEPSSTIFESIYGLGIKPLYTLFPKPGALDDAMLYVLTGNDTQAMSAVTNDLEAAQVELDIWTPLVSNVGFVIVILSISCIYVARKEF